MINLDNHEIELTCPSCEFYCYVTLKQVRLKDPVICRGCRATINFDDHMNTTRKTLRSINRAMRDLEETLRNFGNVTTKL